MADVVDEDEYRRAMGRYAAGVAIISARQGSHDLAMTASSLVSVSLEPPTVLFCVHSQARLAEAVGEGSKWAVSILGPALRSQADWFASPGRPTLGQFDRIDHWRGEFSGAAILTGASAWLECETEWVRSAGSHDVVTGTVACVGVDPQASGGLVHFLGQTLPVR